MVPGPVSSKPILIRKEQNSSVHTEEFVLNIAASRRHKLKEIYRLVPVSAG